jgi:hypothetical protein
VPQRLFQCEAIPSHRRLLLIYRIIYYKKDYRTVNTIKVIYYLLLFIFINN